VGCDSGISKCAWWGGCESVDLTSAKVVDRRDGWREMEGAGQMGDSAGLILIIKRQDY